MNPTVDFAKLSGSGNDFICIDNRDGRFDSMIDSPERVGRFARTCCRRGLSVGADGVFFACASETPGFADVGARHFEPDGSEAELCGNGAACFTRWVIDNGWVKSDEVKILTSAGVVRGKRLDANYVRVCIPLPENLQRNGTLEIDSRKWEYDFVVTGVPHLVTYVPDIERADVAHWGPLLRHHPRFAPRGVNADFVQVLGEGEIALRTWEFGVEGETLACGTGSAASSILTALRFGWPKAYTSGEKPVRVHARSGDVLRVYFTLQSDGSASDVCLETFVRFVYTGSFHPELAAMVLPDKPATESTT